MGNEIIISLKSEPTHRKANKEMIKKISDKLEVEYSISDKKEGNSESYGILSSDVQIRWISDNKLVIVSRRNLYRMKK
jgi:hypothetical protein